MLFKLREPLASVSPRIIYLPYAATTVHPIVV